MAVGGVAVVSAGGIARNPVVVIVGITVLFLGRARARGLLRGIDAGDLPGDGRPLASLSWVLAAAGNLLSIFALVYTLL